MSSCVCVCLNEYVAMNMHEYIFVQVCTSEKLYINVYMGMSGSCASVYICVHKCVCCTDVFVCMRVYYVLVCVHTLELRVSV